MAGSDINFVSKNWRSYRGDLVADSPLFCGKKSRITDLRIARQLNDFL